MLSIFHNIDRLRRVLPRLLRLVYPVGFCAACQRDTEWRDAGLTFVCRSCGTDPVFGGTLCEG